MHVFCFSLKGHGLAVTCNLLKTCEHMIVSMATGWWFEIQPDCCYLFLLFPSQKYDEQLGVVAQAHAEACKWGPNLAAAGAYPAGLGENLAFRFGNDATGAVHPTHFVHEWFAESAFFNFTTGYCAPRETCTHYMQVGKQSLLKS